MALATSLKNVFALALLLACPALLCAQTVSGVSGTLTQGQTVTISGSSFGTKSPAAPRIWDDAEGTNPLTLWDQAEPTTAGSNCGLTTNLNCNMAYRTPINGVSLPHSATGNTKYAAGAHRILNTATGGNQVWLVDQRGTMSTYPYWVRWEYYWRADPNWANPDGDPDDNWKMHTVGVSLLSSLYWYYEYSSRPATSATTVVSQDASDSGSLGYRCRSTVVGACHSGGGAQTVGYSAGDSGPPYETNPINQWIHVEFIEQFTRNVDGYVIRWEDGTKVFHSVGETDQETGTLTREESIGSYARSRGPNNFRYFDDIYYDWGQDALANVKLCANATCTSGWEPQIISAWSSSSITVTWNTGAIGAGTAYVMVCDRTNTCGSGFSVTNGGSQGGGGSTKYRLRRPPVFAAALFPVTFFLWRQRRRRVH